MNKKINEIINILDDNVAIEILKESEKCFKIGADRAALLFAFNSLMHALKNKLIKAGKPKDVAEGEWDSFYQSLLNDDKTEKVILNEICNNNSKYFTIEERLKQDMQYWIARRNSCAHWKLSDEISCELVDVFYSFYLHNVYRFQLGSSVEQILTDLYDVYDITKNPPGTSPEIVIRRISYAIKNEEFDSLVSSLLLKYDFNISIESPLLEITKYMYMILDENKTRTITNKIRTTPRWASFFLEKYPRYFDYIFRSKDDFFEIIKIDKNCCCKLFCVFEKQGLFCKNGEGNDYEKFYKFIFDNNIFCDEWALYTDDFYNYVKTNLQQYFQSWGWLNTNERCDTLIRVLTMKKPDFSIFDIIIKHYSNSFNSYFFLERLKYDSSKSFNKELLNIASAKSVSIPSRLLNILQANN